MKKLYINYQIILPIPTLNNNNKFKSHRNPTKENLEFYLSKKNILIKNQNNNMKLKKMLSHKKIL